jgi:hypothetical protein
VAFVREWARRLGASGDPDLEALGVLVRPHPQNFGSWRDADIDEPGRIVVWPRGGVAPTDRSSKKDYFDSLYHATAVVGINTTALVDSAIVRRPVFTMVHEQFRSTQTGTLHFSYLAREEGNGLLNVAHSWDEHFDQLGAALRGADGHRERIDGFLEAFVRPHRLERPAAPLAVDAIVRTALGEKEPASEGGPVGWVVGATASALGRVHLALKRLRPHAMRRRMLKWRKERRRRRASTQRDRKRSDRAAARVAKPGKPAKPPKPDKNGRNGTLPPRPAEERTPERQEASR